MATTVSRRFPGLSAKRAFMMAHEALLRFGLVVLPDHYYTPVANIRWLRRNKAEWTIRSDMVGIDANPSAQLALLAEYVKPFEPEYAGNKSFIDGIAGGCGPGFGYIEAQCLHGFIRGFKPKRIVEIGSGVSTNCMLAAAALNNQQHVQTTITCIEPYPSSWLRSAPVNLVAQRVQSVDSEVFDQLQDGDLLFVDSTHAVKVGGDVVRIMLEIIPRLRPGVHVHFHDIYFPFSYQRDILQAPFQWMETAFLQALLVHNSRLKILFSLSQLHYDHAAALHNIFPEYRPEVGQDGLRMDQRTDRHFPSSTYLTVTA